MKKVLVTLVALVTAFAFVATAQAGVVDDKCAKCHKAEKTVDKVAEAKGIKDADSLVKAVRGGSKAAMHKAISDEDLKTAAGEVFKGGKAPAKKKKAAEGC
ncbi:MAG TPA: hypothetical protein VK445_08835 [Dissulfurispiraceae bacterium]|nr:hypothetical protein [Dissulfurispiraceae bacterium]